MHRIYVPSRNISLYTITLDDKAQIHHLRGVLRLRDDEGVVIFDDRAREYLCILQKLSENCIIFQIKKRLARKESETRITVACAIPKGSAMDDIIAKLTQLGVARIIPLLTERVVVKMNREKKAMRHERWKKIALNASLQSQRNILPAIDPIKDIGEFLAQTSGFDLKLIPTLLGERRPLKEIFLESQPRNILIIIGPEGDFTAEEVEAAKSKGFIPVSLGDLVLRVETAALATVSFVRLYADS